MFGLFKKKNTIQSEILSDLRQAKKSIKIAVSWFTDPILLDELIQKAKSKIEVQVILSADKWNIIEFEKIKEIQRFGGIVNKKGAEDVINATFDNRFMHCKFYIIDNNFAKGGSYNFSKNASESQDNQLKKISDPNDFNQTVEEFEELRLESVDFFTNITNPEKIRAELAPLEKRGMLPEQRQQFETANKLKQQEIENERLAKIVSENRAQRQHEEVAKVERERLAKIEDDRKLQEQQAAAQRASTLEIQLAKERAERERLAKIEADRKAKEQAAQYKPKEEVKETTLPPTSYA